MPSDAIQTDEEIYNLRRIWHGLGATRLEEIQAMKKAESKRVQAKLCQKPNRLVGRIVGSLCAVTAKNGDAQSAVLASWVSQASLIPVDYCRCRQGPRGGILHAPQGTSTSTSSN